MRGARSLLLAVTLLPAAAEAVSLSELLAAVAATARFPTPARADVRVERGGAVTELVLVGRGRTVYLETRDGFRALVRPQKAVVGGADGARRAPVGTALPGTDLLLEDLAVFSVTSLRVPMVSDEGRDEVVVSGAPSAPSAYAFLVHRIDPTAARIVRTQYYRDSVSNLVKMRHDGEVVEVAGGVRPAASTVEDLRARTTSRLAWRWRVLDALPPRLFTLRGLREASGLPPG